jgi:GAF domain-containing protein
MSDSPSVPTWAGARQPDALQLSPTTRSALFEDLPAAGNTEPALCILERVRQSLLGDGLLTVTVILKTRTEVAETDLVNLQRVWSSLPAVYPVAGRKRKTLTPWTRQLVQRGEVFVGEGDASLAHVFDDHAQIAELDLHAVINVPLLAEGRCMAIFNVLGSRPHWQSHEVMLVRLLASLATPWILRASATIDQQTISGARQSLTDH